MKAHEIMKKQVITVNESVTVRSVVEKFIKHQISGLPVINDHNEIVAYISDGDIMRYIGKHKDIVVDTIAYINVVKGDDVNFEQRVKNILDVNVLKVAKKKIAKVSWDDDMEDIAAILGRRRIKKLPVERDGKLVGIISRGDVIRHAFNKML